jgi:hypothetical protein
MVFPEETAVTEMSKIMVNALMAQKAGHFFVGEVRADCERRGRRIGPRSFCRLFRRI